MVSSLTFKSLTHFKLFFSSVCKIGVQFHSFVCEYPIFPAPFIEETAFSPLSNVGKCQLTIYAQIYFWTLNSVPLAYVSVFMPAPCHFDYYGFIIQAEIRKCGASHSVVVFQDYFGYSGFQGFYIKLGIVFLLFLKKSHWNLDRNCFESIDGFEQYGHFNY